MGLKILVVLPVIGIGVFHINTANHHPFFPYVVRGAFTGAATVFFAVFGFDAMSTAAEESKDAQRHMPKAIIYSLAICMVLYVAACLVLTGMFVMPGGHRLGVPGDGLPWAGTVRPSAHG